MLVRPSSRAALEGYIASLGAHSMKAIAGDITQPMLGLNAEDRARLKGADIFHLAAVYDLEAAVESNERANVEGTRSVVELAQSVGARLHHMSSIAVAGGAWKGKFTEEMFAEARSSTTRTTARSTKRSAWCASRASATASTGPGW